MPALLAFAASVTAAPVARDMPQGEGRAMASAQVSARASARVLPAVMVRQGDPVPPPQPDRQVSRQPDGTVLIEFT